VTPHASDLPRSKAASEDLVKLLENPNAWQRETAQRLLVEREWRGVAEKLQEVAATSPSAQGRVHALWTLQGIDCLTPAEVQRAAADENVHVRRQAALFGEKLPALNEKRRILDSLRSDSSAAVRFQAMLSSSLDEGVVEGEVELDAKALAQLRTDADNSWMRAGIRIFEGPYSGTSLVRQLLAGKRDRQPAPGEIALVRELGEAAKFDRAHDILLDAIDAAMQAMHQPDQIEIAVAALHALARAAARQGMSLDRAAGVDRLAILRRQLEEILASRTKPSALPDTIGLLSYLPDSEPLLTSLAQPTQDQSIRVAAMGALAKQQGSDPWPPLLDGFSAETPVIRRALVDGLLANTERTKLLLDAIEAGQIKTSELDVAHVNRLTNHRDAGVKQRARELLAAATPQDRAQALADYQPVLQMNGDALRGQAVFEKNCAACHKIGETGVNVAPDISDSRTKTAAQLLTDILQPNRAIDNNYVGYNVRLVDGTVQTGILTAETATSITLRQQGGKDAVIPRSEIEELKSTGQSLMPEGLERQIPHADMADLLSFIKNWRYLDGRIPITVGGPQR
jgi:putative heme-binding domain-containing protein